MDIELLRTFLAVRDTRHFGKAAQSLKITQAAASFRIKQLENKLDAPLFMRFRNNLQLTEAGDRLVPYAEDMLLSWEKARQQVNPCNNGRKTLRFGAINGFCGIILRQCLSPIYDAVADINLRVESLDEGALTKRLQERRLDLALLYDPSRHADYHSIPVSSVELVHVATSPGLTQSDTLQEQYIAVEWGSFYNNRLFNLAGFIQEPVLRVSDSSHALQFLLEQGGHAFLPYRLVREHLEARLFPVAGAEILHQPIYAVYHQASVLGGEISMVVDIIRQHAGPYTKDLDAVMADYLKIPAAG